MAGVLILVLSGCGSSSTSQSTASARPVLPASRFSATVPGGSAGTASETPASPAASPLDVQAIPQAWTTPILDAKTDGAEIVWSKGGDSIHGAPDLYAYVPGSASPVLVYRGANREAQLMPIAVSHHRYAFEEIWGDGNTGYWKLYYVSSPGAPPQLIDSNAADPQDLAAPATWIAMTSDRLIWNSAHAGPSGPRWYLRSYDFATGVTRNLLDADGTATEYWFPDADDSGRLVYATVEYGSHPQEPAYHVYLAQITDGPLQPRQLDHYGYATEPVLSGDTVVWKSVAYGSVASMGPLTRYSIRTGSTSPISMLGGGDPDYETAGNRFVAAWTDHTVFSLYDLETDTSLLVEEHAPTAMEGVVRPAVAGDLVVFIRMLDSTNRNLQLCWLRLPPPT